MDKRFVVGTRNLEILNDKLDNVESILQKKITQKKEYLQDVNILVNNSMDNLYTILKNLDIDSKMQPDKSIPCLEKEEPMDEIVQNLFLGDYESSTRRDLLDKHGIKHIVRVMPDPDDAPQKFDHITYVQVPIKDNETCGINLNHIFDYTTDYIAQQLTKGEPVLVHCKRGHHRSATIVAAYLLRYHKVDLESIVKRIKSFRPCALRRDVCMMDALKNYKKTLIGSV